MFYTNIQGCTCTPICLNCRYTTILAIRSAVLILIPIFMAGCINLHDIIIISSNYCIPYLGKSVHMHAGMLLVYSVDPRTRDRGPRDPRPRDPNWRTLYMYVHRTCVSNYSTGIQTWIRLWNGLSMHTMFDVSAGLLH